MRKILISVLVCLLLIGSAFFMVNGISRFNIQGIKGLDEENNKVEKKISDLSNVISVTYTNTESNLKRTANTLQDSKTEYENQAALSNSQNPSYVSKLETYDIDYLWTKLGNYAKDENVVIKIELVSSGLSTNLYNLNFTTTGEYVSITDFIYDIENDSKLGFKIDEFKMGVSSENSLTATFSCKEIPIKVGSLDQTTSNNQESSASNTAGGANTSASSNATASSNSSATTNSATVTQPAGTNTAGTNTTGTNTAGTTGTSTNASR